MLPIFRPRKCSRRKERPTRSHELRFQISWTEKTLKGKSNEAQRHWRSLRWKERSPGKPISTKLKEWNLKCVLKTKLEKSPAEKQGKRLFVVEPRQTAMVERGKSTQYSSLRPGRQASSKLRGERAKQIRWEATRPEFNTWTIHCPIVDKNTVQAETDVPHIL